MRRSRQKTARVILIFGIVLLILAGIVAVRMYCEYVQFLEIGYQYTSIFVKNLTARLTVQGISLAIIFIFLLVNNFVIRRVIYEDNHDLHVVKSKTVITVLTFIMALIVSAIVSEGLYQDFLKFQNVTWFGENDPVFGWDVGYYVFTRPFFMTLVDSAKGILLFNIIYTLLVYILLQLRGGTQDLKKLFKNKGIFVHCFINLMLFIIMTALVYKFNIEDLLYHTFCSVTGAGATDMRIWYLYYKIAPFLLIIIVPISIYFLSDGKFKRALVTLSSFPVIWILAVLCAVINQTVFVDGDELAAEGKYLAHNIEMTRRAYGLNAFQEKEYEINNDLSYKDVTLYADVLENTNITGDDQLLNAVKKLQGAGNYETFTDTDIIPYTINGRHVPVSIAAREIDSGKLSKSADSYLNERFKYTHGTGIVMTEINQADEEGNPVFLIKDIPVLSDFGITQVKQPRIYYGENTNHTVMVKTQYTESDYENTENGASYRYDGFGGIQMTATNRLALALSEGDYKILFSSQITNESRALVNRNILKRVNKIAPFFMYDADPYLILTDDGQLKWIIDAYAVTDKYPYSTVMGNINYIRNCAKVVVDAYHGNVTFYATDWDNPFVQTYNKMYPGLFSKEEIPDSIKNHLRYPQDLFKIQTQMYQRYHVTDTEAFYSDTDEWVYAKVKNPIEPYYTVVRTDAGAGMNLMTIYTPYKGNSTCAYITAGSDINNYGEVNVYKISESENHKAYGVAQAESIINADTALAEWLKELGQNGLSVSKGPLTAIPVKSTMIYAQAVYTTDNGTLSTPKRRGVIAVYNGKAAFADTLANAVRNLLSKDSAGKINPPVINAPSSQTEDELLDRAIDMYRRAKEYNRVGDWENYGKAMKEFDDVMTRLAQLKQDADLKNSFVGPMP